MGPPLRCLWGLALLGQLACFPRGWQGDAPALDYPPDFPFQVGPYLMALGPGKLAVVLEHPLATPPTVTYGPAALFSSTSSSAGLRTMSATPSNGRFVAILEGLPDDVELAYRVHSSVGDVGPVHFFAGRSRGRPFRFAAFGDTRSGHQVHRALIEAMRPEAIDFVIHSGDMVETGGFVEEWQTFFRVEGPLLVSRPIFGAIGNHDLSRARFFEHYFLSDLRGARYFYQDWGDLRIVVMDSEIEGRAGSAQYAFLERALAEGAAEQRLMVMVLHYPPWSSGAHGSNLEFRRIIGELAPRFGVELVLAGHDHNYERTKPIDGVTYMVAASSGATIRRMSPSDFSANVRTEPHFVLFDVERGALVGRAINLAGDTFDSFVIPPNPPRESP